MQRIAEPELMDEKEAALAYDAADFSAAHEVFVDYFAHLFPGFQNGLVLDLGCGTGDIAIRFARRYPRTTLIGLDGARAMLEIARINLGKHGLTDRIQLVQAYLPTDKLLLPKFDVIICNSLLHHLADPHILWQTIAAKAKKGAPFLVMDLLRPQSLEEAQNLVLQYANDAPPRLQEDFYASLLAAYTVEEVKKQLQAFTFVNVDIAIISDRHFIVRGQA